MSLPWFRMYAEFSGDPIVQSLSFDDQRHYIVLLCLKCSGLLDRDISPQSRRELIVARGLGLDAATASEVKRRLSEIGLIAKDWHPSAWDKRQFVSDVSTKRVRKHRKENEVGNVSETENCSSGNSPETETETEQNRTEKEEESIAGRLSLPVCPHQRILDLYHEKMPEKRRHLVWDGRRAENLSSRWRWLLTHKSKKTGKPYFSTTEEGVEWFGKFFDYCRKSNFLMSKFRGFCFEWAVKKANFDKIIEGTYDNEPV